MDVVAAFPDFDERRVVHRGNGVLVVDKPPGVPSQAADPDVADDLPARLRGLAPYLGTHQRLDAETSGLVLFTTDRALNPSVAAQFEQRRVKKTYLAGVTGWPRQQRTRTLRGLVDGKQATTHVKLLEARDDRCLLELALETGRNHQARAQLAQVGASIAGDDVYGGARAPRLMLHARTLELSIGGTKRRFDAPTPPELLAWLETGREVGTLDGALALAFERRWGLLRAMPPGRRTDVFRLVDSDGDALPGVTVDFYAGFAVTRLLEDAAFGRGVLLDALAVRGFEGVYDKSRPEQTLPLRGTPAVVPLEVFEEGIPYLVRLDGGLATGLYTDQRRNRVRVRNVARGKRVLNLFAYTCAFSIAAAKGGAATVVSVDASPAALERGQAGFVHANVDPAGHEPIVMDAGAFLERAARRNERFDLVILDPPSFGRAKGTRFSIASDLPHLCALALRLLAPHGEMLASMNHQKTTQARFRHLVQDAARSAGVDAKVRDLPLPLDHRASPLKAVWATRS